MPGKEIFESKRRQLVEYMSGFAIKTLEVKNAFLSVSRENFLPENLKEYSYDDNAVTIGMNQTISQPSTIAVMLELLNAGMGMKVLEVGSGSGYVLALLSKIVGAKGEVFGVEIIELLAKKAVKNLKKEKIGNAEVRTGDGAQGWAEKAPFERIIISCACPFIPKELFNQLKEGGRIVAPVGDEGTQIMEILMKKDGKPVKRTLESQMFAFVPLKGKSGFRQGFP